jgi:hypothetical protein
MFSISLLFLRAMRLGRRLPHDQNDVLATISNASLNNNYAILLRGKMLMGLSAG